MPVSPNESVAELERLWKQSGLSQAEIAEQVGCSKTTVSRIISGALPVDSETRRKVVEIIEIAAKDHAPTMVANGRSPLHDPTPHAPPTSAPTDWIVPTLGCPWGGAFCTAGQRLMWSLLTATREDREFTLLVGPSGCGKTHVVNAFVKQHPEILKLQAQMGMNGSWMLGSLCELFGVSAKGSIGERTDRLLQAASGQTLIVDEADLLVSGRHDSQVLSRLEIFRQLYGAGAAVVLVGLPTLHQAVVNNGETYVFRRIGYFRAAPSPTQDELSAFWRAQVAGYPTAVDRAGPMALLAARHGLFGYLHKLARRTRVLDGDVEAASSLLFHGEQS